MKLLIFLLLSVSAFAQAATHSVTLTWLDASNPTGTTYNVYRSTGLCSGTPVFSKLASGVTLLTYKDTSVGVGNFCYEVTATVNSIEGPASNLVNPQVAPFAVSLSVTVP
jgi:hypothetical protein